MKENSRQEPTELEARRFAHPVDIGELSRWCGGEWYFGPGATQYIVVPTPEGEKRADPGDWIVRDERGRFRVDATYEPVGRADSR